MLALVGERGLPCDDASERVDLHARGRLTEREAQAAIAVGILGLDLVAEGARPIEAGGLGDDVRRRVADDDRRTVERGARGLAALVLEQRHGGLEFALALELQHLLHGLDRVAELIERSGVDARPEEFKRYGSARQLYNFDVDNAAAY